MTEWKEMHWRYQLLIKAWRQGPSLFNEARVQSAAVPKQIWSSTILKQVNYIWISFGIIWEKPPKLTIPDSPEDCSSGKILTRQGCGETATLSWSASGVLRSPSMAMAIHHSQPLLTIFDSSLVQSLGHLHVTTLFLNVVCWLPARYF